MQGIIWMLHRLMGNRIAPLGERLLRKNLCNLVLLNFLRIVIVTWMKMIRALRICCMVWLVRVSELMLLSRRVRKHTYLISEARSQTHSTDYMDLYSLLDEMMPDSNQGFGDMLSVRGEAILSWTAADYFIVEENEIPSYEASCLSLNLNTLNKQLAKVDLAQRLFVDEYYLIEGKIEAPWLTPDFGSENAILDLLVVIPSTTWDICYSATQVEATQVGINVTLPSTLPISLENMHMFVYVSSCHNCKPNLD